MENMEKSVNIVRMKDNDGRIIRWPKKMAEKQAVLEYLLLSFHTIKWD